MNKIRLKRNGKIWENGQSGEPEEILDVFIGENLDILYPRGCCNEAFKDIFRVDLNHGAEVVVEFNIKQEKL